VSCNGRWHDPQAAMVLEAIEKPEGSLRPGAQHVDSAKLAIFEYLPAFRFSLLRIKPVSWWPDRRLSQGYAWEVD